MHGLYAEEDDLENARFGNVYPARYAEFGLIDRAANEDDSFYEETLKVRSVVGALSGLRLDSVTQAERMGLKHVGPGLLSVDPNRGIAVFMLSFNPLPEFDQKVSSSDPFVSHFSVRRDLFLAKCFMGWICWRGLKHKVIDVAR